MRDASGQANVGTNLFDEVSEADITLDPDVNPSAGLSTPAPSSARRTIHAPARRQLSPPDSTPIPPRS